MFLKAMTTSFQILISKLYLSKMFFFSFNVNILFTRMFSTQYFYHNVWEHASKLIFCYSQHWNSWNRMHFSEWTKHCLIGILQCLIVSLSPLKLQCNIWLFHYIFNQNTMCTRKFFQYLFRFNEQNHFIKQPCIEPAKEIKLQWDRPRDR